jgi:DNA primase
MESRYDFSDPVTKTEFYRELAAKLCEFQEPLERQNYIEAVAARYNIPVEDLKSMVASTAARGVPVKTSEKPRTGVAAKKSPDDGTRKNQRLLLTWLASEPHIFPKVSEWIKPEDFSDDLYRKVAKEVFDRIGDGSFVPARILDLAQDEEEQNQIAEILNTELVEITSPEERRKAFKDIILAIRHSGYERQKKELKPDDPEYLTKTIQGKKELERLAHADISPDQ